MRESKVEDHLVARVEAAKGFVRKLVWVGRRGAPDRFIAIPAPHPRRGMWLIELKRPGKDAEAHQAREHKRLRDTGVRVLVLDSIEAVDVFMDAPAEVAGTSELEALRRLEEAVRHLDRSRVLILADELAAVDKARECAPCGL